MSPLASEMEDFLRNKGGGSIPPNLADKLNAWIRQSTANGWSPDDCEKMGCCALFADIEGFIDGDKISFALAEELDEEDAGAAESLTDLNLDQCSKVIRAWLSEHFEDPDRGGIIGYGIFEASLIKNLTFSILIFWDMDPYAEDLGTPAAAFRSSSEALDWLRNQAILDIDWIEDRDDREVRRAVTALRK